MNLPARPRPVAEAQEDGASSMEAELCAAASGSEIKHESAAQKLGGHYM